MDPLTGFFRNGCCDTGPDDSGRHTVCAIMTEEFLAFSARVGNNLSQALPEYGFPGLLAGQRWCVCVERWVQAYEAGCAPPVDLDATHESALEFVSLAELNSHAIDL